MNSQPQGDWFSDNAPVKQTGGSDWFDQNAPTQKQPPGLIGRAWNVATSPEFTHRIAEQFGIPTSAAEAQTAQEALTPRWYDMLVPGGPVGRGMATELYGAIKRGVSTAAQEGTEAGQNIAGEFVNGRQVPGTGGNILSNIGKAAYGGVVGGLQAASGTPVVGSLIGTAPLQVGEDVSAGNRRGLAGDITGAALQAGLLSLGANKTHGPADLTTRQATERLVNAVNPPAEHVPSFRKALNQHLQKVVDHAAENNLPLENRSDLVTAINGTAEKLRTQYYEDFLGPVKDSQVSTAGIPGYEGSTVDHNTATLSQLDKRLGDINSELHPRYAKAEPAARASVRSAADLTSEANAIRGKLYSEIANRTGIDQKLIADTKAAQGALGDAGARAELSLNKEIGAANAANQSKKVSIVNPLSPDFILDKAATYAYGKLRGSPADKAVAQTFQRLKGATPVAPVMNPPQSAPFPRPPSWQGSEPLPTVLPSLMEESRGQGNVGQRPPLNRPNLMPRRPSWQTASEPVPVPSILEQGRAAGNVGQRPPMTSQAAPFPRQPIYQQIDRIMEMAKNGEISPGEASRRISLLGGKTAIRRLQGEP